MSQAGLLSHLVSLANPEIAEHSKRFFKTGIGQYGEDDEFLGIRVPDQRKVARKFKSIPLEEIAELLKSNVHEVRLTSIFILVLKYQYGDVHHQKEIFDFYVSRLDRINNWDLVDSSAKQIAGHYLFDKNRNLLYQLAESDNLWKRRVSIIATHHFINHGELDDTFAIAEQLLGDSHDLIHKAVGWMLREAGKKDELRLEEFLKSHYRKIPRTMLRYAIEKMQEPKRKQFLHGSF